MNMWLRILLCVALVNSAFGHYWLFSEPPECQFPGTTYSPKTMPPTPKAPCPAPTTPPPTTPCPAPTTPPPTTPCPAPTTPPPTTPCPAPTTPPPTTPCPAPTTPPPTTPCPAPTTPPPTTPCPAPTTPPPTTPCPEPTTPPPTTPCPAKTTPAPTTPCPAPTTPPPTTPCPAPTTPAPTTPCPAPTTPPPTTPCPAKTTPAPTTPCPAPTTPPPTTPCPVPTTPPPTTPCPTPTTPTPTKVQEKCCSFNETNAIRIKCGGQCYVVVKEKKTWFDAYAACRNHGMELLVVPSVDEWCLLEKNVFPCLRGSTFWLGARRTDDSGECNFYWASCKGDKSVPFDFNNFCGPESMDGRGKCVAVDGRKPQHPWITQNCDKKKMYFICRA